MSAGEREYYRLSSFGRDGVDRTEPAAGEHFDARKLRYRLKRVAREFGVSDTSKLGERGAELLEAMARTPRFRVVFAESVPGRANAEAIGAAVLAEIRGS